MLQYIDMNDYKYPTQDHRKAIAFAIGLSTVLIAIISVLGREALNIQSALLGDIKPHPNEVTVIAALQQEAGYKKIENVILPEKRTDDLLYPFYAKADGQDIYGLLIQNPHTHHWNLSGTPTNLRVDNLSDLRIR